MCCGRSLLNEERRIENGELRMKNGKRGDRIMGVCRKCDRYAKIVEISVL